jgi:hypothetical protein
MFIVPAAANEALEATLSKKIFEYIMKPKQGKQIFLGELGESVFYQPFFDFRTGIEVRQEMPDLFGKAEKSGDERSYVLVNALIIEYYLDRLLKAIFPKFNKLTKRQEITFSVKILLVESLDFIPYHIIQCCDCVKGIRNQFAHNLKINNIEEISEDRKQFLKQLYSFIWGDCEKETTKELFRSISFMAINGLSAYEPNIKFLRKKIDTPEFIMSLYTESEKEVNEDIN